MIASRVLLYRQIKDTLHLHSTRCAKKHKMLVDFGTGASGSAMGAESRQVPHRPSRNPTWQFWPRCELAQRVIDRPKS
jgi:hypothetical protein